MLVDSRLAEAADDSVILFDLHKGFQIDVGDAGGLFLQGKQQGKILLPVTSASDFPQPLADGFNAVQQTVVIAERAGQVAFVGFAHRAEPRAQQAAAAAAGKTDFRADKQGTGRRIRRPGKRVVRARHNGLQTGNGKQYRFSARFHSGLNLAEYGQGNLLLPAAERLISG